MSFCEVPKCANEVHAAGLCFKHYTRVRRHGTVDGGRNGDGRVKSTHPLWEAYKSLLRVARKTGGYDLRWDDFWTFIEDVGEKPEGARLYRKDQSLPYSKENTEWRKPIIDVSQLADAAAYQRAWRMKRPNLARAANLKKSFDLTLDQYNRMLAGQNAVCAICRKPEKMRHATTGEVKSLCVDHDHKTKIVRGLLCQACNTGIGKLGDSIDLLRSAIAYLEQHARIDIAAHPVQNTHQGSQLVQKIS